MITNGFKESDCIIGRNIDIRITSIEKELKGVSKKVSQLETGCAVSDVEASHIVKALDLIDKNMKILVNDINTVKVAEDKKRAEKWDSTTKVLIAVILTSAINVLLGTML